MNRPPGMPPDLLPRSVVRALAALGPDLPSGLDGVRRHRRLAGGASGSAVHLLSLDGDREVVLKVTGGGDRARRELGFYREVAALLPVRTPRLLAGVETADGQTVLLLTRARPAAPPDRWAARDWERAAAQLGALHRPEVAESVTGFGLLTRTEVGGPAAADAAGAVRAAWRRLGHEHLAGPLLDRRAEFDRALPRLPTCLCHGDWHVANLLLEGDEQDEEFVWIDWQEVGLGHGPGDLALLWQRAEFDGGEPPREAMFAAYARARGVPLDATLRAATAAAEIRLILYGWPDHLQSVDASRRDVVLGRLSRLAAEWETFGRAPVRSR
ncbi:aminoglycoside phosphotransferase family protein [Actinopolymorpha sp. NPDC004070]|uniref:phosphotransferase family protein n=1 Tax=Actinopolymorpha sp. NPDC004070 TaxID=3154548 RepID=UPI0033A2A02A